jgi:hypothetical protein
VADVEKLRDLIANAKVTTARLGRVHGGGESPPP